MTEIKFSQEAILDLQQAKSYISEEFSSEQAMSFVAKFIEKIKQLSDYPENIAPLFSIVDFETDYRFLICGNYTAFYKIENHTVNIIRVLYRRSNFMQILFGKPSDN